MMSNLHLHETVVEDHRSALLREAWVQRLRRRNRRPGASPALPTRKPAATPVSASVRVTQPV